MPNRIEELADMIRRYASEHFPNWSEARITFRGEDGVIGFLLVLPDRVMELGGDEIAQSLPSA